MSVFNDKVVLITGGARGIGKIMARLALVRGAVVIIWDIDRELMGHTVTELSGYGPVFSYRIDVSSVDDVRTAAKWVRRNVGDVDILINNAAIVAGKYFHEHDNTDIDRIMSVNAAAPMQIALEFLPGMLERNSGHICNVASSAGLVSNPGMAVYVASKWAVTGWSDSLRLELRKLKKKVRVTTVTPYYIDTGMFAGVRSLIPLLKPEKVALRIISGIEREKVFVSMPWGVRFLRFFQGLLPIWMFDWFVGNVLGIYRTMDHFTGRIKERAADEKSAKKTKTLIDGANSDG